MMKIVFKKTKENDEYKIVPLFPWNNNSYNNISLETIIRSLNDTFDENTSIFSLDAGNYEFSEIPNSGFENIEILVKCKNNQPIEILKVEKRYSNLKDIANLLNSEVEDNDIKYQMFRVKGKLKN